MDSPDVIKEKAFQAGIKKGREISDKERESIALGAEERLMKKLDEEPKEEKPIKILCVFCNAPWTASMETSLYGVSGGCDSCGYGASAEASISIRCDNCKRIVYKKEFTLKD